MSQQPATDFDIDPDVIGGSDLATLLNTLNDALLSMRSGTSRPPSAEAGTLWLDTAVSATHYVKFFDGTSDIVWFDVDTATHTITMPYVETELDLKLPLEGGVANLMQGPLYMDIEAGGLGLGVLSATASTYGFGLFTNTLNGRIDLYSFYGGLKADDFISCYPNDRVDLCFNNAVKLSTKTDGVDITGDLSADTITAGDGATGTATSANTLTIVDGIITNIA